MGLLENIAGQFAFGGPFEANQIDREQAAPDLNDPAIDDSVHPIEEADSVSPATSGFKIDEATTRAPYHFKGVTSAQDFEDRCLEVIGYNLEGTDGRIRRILPRSYGLCRFEFATSLNMVGYGRSITIEEVEPADGDDPGNLAQRDLVVQIQEIEKRSRQIRPRAIAPDFAVYEEYRGTVEFVQRPYHVLPDDSIGVFASTWSDEKGLPRDFIYAEEWMRYVEIDETFDPKIITATQGQLIFQTEDGGQPAGQAFAGTPRIPYPESVITLMWHQVPYRYVSSPNSFLKRFANRVNQARFTIQDYVFEPGQMLYLGYGKPKRYTPPFPLRDPRFDFTRYVLEKWVNLEITFAICSREPTSVPPDLLNANWVPRNWNALPWFGPGNVGTPQRGFHYVCNFNPFAPKDRHYWQPLFESAPFELLFTDPDVQQPPGFV